MRVLIDNNPLAPSNAAPTDFRAAYRARPAWIAPPTMALPPEVTAYRLRFELPASCRDPRARQCRRTLPTVSGWAARGARAGTRIGPCLVL